MNYNDVLLWPDMDIWGSEARKDSHSKELLVMRAREGFDSFSRKLSSISVPLMDKIAPCIKPDPELEVLAISDHRVFRLTLWITSIIASMMPVVSIVILIKLKDLSTRLGMIAVFNLILSVYLLVFTDAKRMDVFAVTAA
jgi:hypothetical protein